MREEFMAPLNELVGEQMGVTAAFIDALVAPTTTTTTTMTTKTTTKAATALSNAELAATLNALHKQLGYDVARIEPLLSDERKAQLRSVLQTTPLLADDELQ